MGATRSWRGWQPSCCSPRIARFRLGPARLSTRRGRSPRRRSSSFRKGAGIARGWRRCWRRMASSRNGYLFTVGTLLSGRGAGLKAGEYEFAAGHQSAPGPPISSTAARSIATADHSRRADQRQIVGAARRGAVRSTGRSTRRAAGRHAAARYLFLSSWATRGRTSLDAHAPRDGAGAGRGSGRERAPDLPLASPARGADPRLDRREGDGEATTSGRASPASSSTG